MTEEEREAWIDSVFARLREPMSWTPEEVEAWVEAFFDWWWQSKPVRASLKVLEELDLLVSCRGRTDRYAPHAFEPFVVTIKRTPLTDGTPESEPGAVHDGNGREIALERRPTFLVTTPRALHAVVREALRRAEEARAQPRPEEEP
jgi:hypothetical protein